MNQKHSHPIWLQDVRSDWSIKRLKHATYLKARVGWHGLTSADYLDKGAFLVTGTDFHDGWVNWETCYHVSEERYQQDPYIQLKEGDLLITKDGTIGKVALVEGLDEPATLNSGIFVTRPLKGIYINKFMYWLLQSIIFQSFIDYIKVGTTINHLYQNQLSDFAFPVPSLKTQESIASFLDRKTAAIDTLIAKKQRLIQLLEEKRTALLNQAVTKGLNLNAPMKDSGISWIGEIPEHWEALKLKRFADVSYGLTLELDRNEVDGTFIISLPNITKDGRLILEDVPKTPLSDTDKKELLLEKGDLLFNWRNGSSDHVGKTAYFEAEGEYIHVSFLLRIRMDKTKNDPRYFHMYLGHLRNTGFFSAAKTRVNNSFNQEELNSLEVMLPPYSEQVAIATYLKIETSKIDNIVAKTRISIEKLQEYRRSLITAAVTGKLDISQEKSLNS